VTLRSGIDLTIQRMCLAPLLMGYIAMSTVVYFIVNMLGEMTTYLPVRDVSVPYFINRFTEPSLGFAIV
jgi:amino acid transporter